MLCTISTHSRQGSALSTALMFFPSLASTPFRSRLLIVSALLGSFPLQAGTPGEDAEKKPATALAASRAEPAPSKAGSAEPAAGAPSQAVGKLPRFPSELYSKLSDATRPQWRQLYRPTVTRCLNGRQQAALAVGAVVADLFLAAQARDSQQVRNLLQDEETIEKTLGISESMGGYRTEVLGAAEQSDWARLGIGIEKLSNGQRRYFRSQKDAPLAELAYIGQWLRTFQTCHAVVLARGLENHQLAIGNPRLIAEMNRRLLLLSKPETETNRCLRLLHKRLAGLAKLWPADGSASSVSNPATRLRRSSEILGDAVGQLIQEEDSPVPGAVVAPKP
jgi:hypothetical protein